MPPNPAALDATNEKLERLEGAVFGFWNAKTNKLVPGILQTVATFQFQVKLALGGIGLLTLVGALHSLGVPTESIGQAIVQAIYSSAISHPPVP